MHRHSVTALLSLSLFLTLGCGGGGGGKNDGGAPEPAVLLKPIGEGGKPGVRFFNGFMDTPASLFVDGLGGESAASGALSSEVVPSSSSPLVSLRDAATPSGLLAEKVLDIEPGAQYTVYGFGSAEGRKTAVSRSAGVPFPGQAIIRVIAATEELSTLTGFLEGGGFEFVTFQIATTDEMQSSYISYGSQEILPVTFALRTSADASSPVVGPRVKFNLRFDQPQTLVVYGTASHPQFALLRD